MLFHHNAHSRRVSTRRECCVGAVDDASCSCTSDLNVQAIFDVFSGKKMASIQKKINSSPEQKLKFETPQAEFHKRIVYFCTCRLTLHSTI